ncbi:hypothetical protein [Catenulispora rubra]|uniref:hypothetical protein n=1 Tax=Catenulispora rubra TaxID=280293 RepID=UPI0018924966|nr:hypothetical protein [Catenulispora rubra]
MTKFLLSLHVLAAIIAVGPVAVAASMFPKALRRAYEDAEGAAWPRLLYRVCRVYAGVGIAVPVFGFATASNMGVLGSAWLITAIGLTAVAAGVLALWILPAQQAALEDLAGAGDGADADAGGVGVAKVAARLGAATGVFNLLWATVTVLMIVRPGSTTGA